MARRKDAVKQEYERHPFLLTIEDVLRVLETNIETGLTDGKVQELQAKYGANRLSGEGGVKWYTLLIKQISNAMILVSCCVRFLYLSSRSAC